MYGPYVSVAEKRAKAEKSLDRLRKKYPDLEPVSLDGKKLGSTWWGQAWNKNLESYADYANRIARGRSYVNHGAVLNLKIHPGKVEALVQGSASKPYEITITIDQLPDKQWKQICQLCNQKIKTLEQLANGSFPKELNVALQDRSYGLFPSPKEIHFHCSCPDGAFLCKHVAAVLYGMGVRLDETPMLFFVLRGVDGEELIRKTVEDKLESMLRHAEEQSERTIAESDVFDLFGVGADIKT